MQTRATLDENTLNNILEFCDPFSVCSLGLTCKAVYGLSQRKSLYENKPFVFQDRYSMSDFKNALQLCDKIQAEFSLTKMSFEFRNCDMSNYIVKSILTRAATLELNNVKISSYDILDILNERSIEHVTFRNCISAGNAKQSDSAQPVKETFYWSSSEELPQFLKGVKLTGLKSFTLRTKNPSLNTDWLSSTVAQNSSSIELLSFNGHLNDVYRFPNLRALSCSNTAIIEQHAWQIEELETTYETIQHLSRPVHCVRKLQIDTQTSLQTDRIRDIVLTISNFFPSLKELSVTENLIHRMSANISQSEISTEILPIPLTKLLVDSLTIVRLNYPDYYSTPFIYELQLYIESTTAIRTKRDELSTPTSHDILLPAHLRRQLQVLYGSIWKNGDWDLLHLYACCCATNCTEDLFHKRMTILENHIMANIQWASSRQSLHENLQHVLSLASNFGIEVALYKREISTTYNELLLCRNNPEPSLRRLSAILGHLKRLIVRLHKKHGLHINEEIMFDKAKWVSEDIIEDFGAEFTLMDFIGLDQGVMTD